MVKMFILLTVVFLYDKYYCHNCHLRQLFVCSIYKMLTKQPAIKLLCKNAKL